MKEIIGLVYILDKIVFIIQKQQQQSNEIEWGTDIARLRNSEQPEANLHSSMRHTSYRPQVNTMIYTKTFILLLRICTPSHLAVI